MVTLRNFAVFQTHLPDDGVEGVQGVEEWAVWPRGNVSRAIGDDLSRRGYGVSESDNQELLGWWVYVTCPGGRRAAVQVSDLGEHLLLVAYDWAGFFRRRVFKRSETAYRDLLVDLSAILAEGPFYDVAWYTRTEYEGSPELPPGAARAVD